MRVLLPFLLAAGLGGQAPLDTAVAADLPRIEALYRHFHAHPELSLGEVETARRLAQELRALKYEVTEGVGGTGVVAVLRNGPGPTVLVRTDMDGLPVKEQTGLPYASAATGRDEHGKEAPAMHACGHDVHMAVLVGTAKALADRRGSWRGTLVLVGQPAEEVVAGAQAMLKDGLFTRFPRPDFNLALHVWGSLPAGVLGFTEGYAYAAVDSVDIAVHGVGAHGAAPHTGKDPVVLASEIVVALQTAVSRETKPGDPAVLTVGTIHGGTKRNIIPDAVKLELTLRSYSPEVRAHLLEAVRRIPAGLAQAAGLPPELAPTVTVTPESSPAVWNDPELTRRVKAACERAFPKDRVVRTEPIMGSEDFSHYGLAEPRIPSLIFWLGGQDPALMARAKAGGPAAPGNHSPFFAPLPEPTLGAGVKAMSTAVLELMAKP